MMTLLELKDEKLEIKPVRLMREKYKKELKNKIFNEEDLYLFHEGRNYNAYNFMGAHFTSENRKRGVRFTGSKSKEYLFSWRFFRLGDKRRE